MTWLVLWHTALPLLVGVLCGRYLHHRRLDQAKRDAVAAFLDEFLDEFPERFADEFSGRLDEAQQQTVPDGWPGWN